MIKSNLPFIVIKRIVELVVNFVLNNVLIQIVLFNILINGFLNMILFVQRKFYLVKEFVVNKLLGKIWFLI